MQNEQKLDQIALETGEKLLQTEFEAHFARYSPRKFSSTAFQTFTKSRFENLGSVFRAFWVLESIYKLSKHSINSVLTIETDKKC